MYEIKVTVEIPGLPEALTALASALCVARPDLFTVGNTGAVAEVPTAAAENPTIPSTHATVNTAPAATTTPAQSSPAAPATAQTILPTTEAKTYSLDDLSRAGATLIDQGKMPQLLELLKRYGVQAVTQLDPGTYPAFVEEMKALGAKL